MLCAAWEYQLLCTNIHPTAAAWIRRARVKQNRWDWLFENGLGLGHGLQFGYCNTMTLEVTSEVERKMILLMIAMS